MKWSKIWKTHTQKKDMENTIVLRQGKSYESICLTVIPFILTVRALPYLMFS